VGIVGVNKIFQRDMRKCGYKGCEVQIPGNHKMANHGWRVIEVTGYGPSRIVKGAHLHMLKKGPPRRGPEQSKATVEELTEHIENPSAIDREYAHQYVHSKSPQLRRAALEHLGSVGRTASVKVGIPNEDISQGLADTLAGIPKEKHVPADIDKMERDRKAAKNKQGEFRGRQQASEEEFYPKPEPATWENTTSWMRAVRGLEDPYAKRRSAFAVLAKLGH